METALSLALLAVSGEDEPADRRDLARLCSRVENDWVGAETGLLDQLASLCSEPGHAVRIDFASLEIEPVPLELGDWTLVTQSSGATHSIAYSGYNDRRRECRDACAQLGIESLQRGRRGRPRRPPGHAAAAHPPRPDRERPRRRDGAARCAPADLEQAGRLLDASHASLRDDYEASVPEVERTVEALKDAGAAGARMVGGGFGGAVVALLRPGVAGPRRGAPSSLPGPPPGSSEPSSSLSGRHSAQAMNSSPTTSIPRPGIQVDVHARGLVDLLLAVEQPEHRKQDAVDDEQAADDAAQVEQVGCLGDAL